MTDTAEVAQAPVVTSDLYKTDADLPGRFVHPDWQKGYNEKAPHPIYRTSSMVYGSRAPSIHTVQTKFKPRSQKFSTHLGLCGMYKNNSLNTFIEKSCVTGPDNANLTKINPMDFHRSYSANPNI